jgi:uncharacterized protein YqeY
MSLVDNLRKDMFEASKEGQKEKSEILKMALAQIQNAQVEVEEKLKDVEIEGILRREVKKVKDSIEQFKEMGRDDLVAKETIQLEVLQSYLPEPLSENEIRKVVKTKIKELGAESMREIGKVMGAAMKEFEGKADGNTVKEIVQELLS